jgi:hydrogenase maturation protease
MTASDLATTAVVAGVGNPYRGDDGLGPVVVARLAGRLPSTVRLLTDVDDPTLLIDAWDDVPLAVVVDAVVSRAPVGTVHEVEILDEAPEMLRRLSTHVFGVAQAIELGMVLGRMPDRLVVLGVEADDVTLGRVHLSPAVESAVDTVVDRVAALVEVPDA